MRRTLQTAIIALMLVVPVVLIAKPVNPQPKKQDAPKAKPAPQIKLEGNTNWGDFEHAGVGRFTLQNHPVWFGIGTLRADGRVMLLWTLRTDDSPCPGVYSIESDGSLVGILGYGHEVKLEKNGELTGNVRPDRVHNLPPPDPPGL